MIGRLTGKLAAKQPPGLLLDVGGVGYEVEAPMSTFYQLPSLGETVTLHTHLTIRDDAHLLFGFATTVEKNLFRELIKVSSVGPKLALAILSGISVAEFWECVRLGETGRLVKIPGIGKKTAERMVVEFSDKAGAADGTMPAAGLPGVAADGASAEARSALTALGYRPAEIDRFLRDLPVEGRSTEQIIQDALRRAVR
jgi:Holliday junction DNA helicase RuvA